MIAQERILNIKLIKRGPDDGDDAPEIEFDDDGVPQPKPSLIKTDKSEQV